jgi:cell division septation protein DedD
MRKIRILLAIQIFVLLLMAPAMGQKAYAVKVDIKDNYDAGLLDDEKDSDKEKAEEAAAAESASSGKSSSKASNSASSKSSTSNKATSTNAASSASSAVSTPATSVSAATSESTPVAATVATTTNDLPKTGDDNRIAITFIVMLASLSVFLTTLLAGRFGKNV